MSRTSMPWSRLAAEFVVIVVGVLVALSADSWAEQRAEIEEARAGLSLVLADLEADSAQYVGNRIKMAEWERNAAWLVANWWRPDLPEDSVEAAFQSFTVGETLQFSRAGFDGLRDSNRLRLISDDSLRTALQDYYQRRQTQLTLALDKTIELADELPRIAAPHLRYEQDVGELSLWPLENGSVHLRAPWSDVREDPVLHQSVLWFGRWAGYMAGELEVVEELLGSLLPAVRAGDGEGRGTRGS